MKYFGVGKDLPSEKWSIKDQIRLLKKNMNEILKGIDARLKLLEHIVGPLQNEVEKNMVFVMKKINELRENIL